MGCVAGSRRALVSHRKRQGVHRAQRSDQELLAAVFVLFVSLRRQPGHPRCALLASGDPSVSRVRRSPDAALVRSVPGRSRVLCGAHRLELSARDLLHPISGRHPALESLHAIHLSRDGGSSRRGAVVRAFFERSDSAFEGLDPVSAAR